MARLMEEDAEETVEMLDVESCRCSVYTGGCWCWSGWGLGRLAGGGGMWLGDGGGGG